MAATGPACGAGYRKEEGRPGMVGMPSFFLCLIDRPAPYPENQKFLVKLFPKSFKERRLFGKRRHPKTFIIYQSL
ncbi:hypothetical protein K6L44_15145 [Gluconacetobacter entanii]|uniref:hypothetical protein n=1 Tax=Gluconacetobacter entanii TaxID=108528 RepID=UPI001C934B4E|nr:hypothetical protein [Gluconacetobacter entanii]MBY4641298.1 hypothetical protein [Gluconacetobacter entanii]MCW4580578.1 hypothetical protein [Gluconacetobacter entanii]MCW4583915.1 hypothetical protein [Gluconacetobacter entanii]MCW4587260.1 hypothetical protein [Gluconacetobacter entanii]